MSAAPVTTESLIQEEVDRTGLPRDFCIRIVAKSAAIRAMARKYDDRFVLKGGTLLYHVYAGRRASHKDADLAEPNATYEDPGEVGKILTIRDGSLHLRGNEGRWSRGEEIIEGLEIPVALGGVAELERKDGLKITVSLRKSEHMDPQGPLQYTDRMLADETSFLVNGLSLSELAAEKIIGWTLRGAQKHYADLGLLARDHIDGLDLDLVEDLVRRKVREERADEATRASYDYFGIKNPRDLAKYFRAPARMGNLHKRNWEQVIGVDFFFLGEEEEVDAPFADVDNVKAKVEEVWGPVLDSLSSRR